jgi:uncharacterized membrane protein
MTEQPEMPEPSEMPEPPAMSEPPASMPPSSGDVTSDDKLWSALAYVFSPLVPIILLLMEDKKNRPFVRYHAYQSLVLGIALWILVMILGIIPLIQCVAWLPWLVMLYFAYKAYLGEYMTAPFVTDFIKKQGWV